MAVDQNDLSKLFIVLSHPLRREILFLIHEEGEQSFTDLMNSLEVNTGRLSFHIRNLRIFLEQTPIGKYRLSRLGQNAIRLIRDAEALSIQVDFAQKHSSLHIAPVKKRSFAFIIDIGVAFTITIATTLLSDYSLLLSGSYFLQFNVLLFLTLLWLYSTLLEGFSGQTLGKAAFGLKVVGVGGKKLSYDTAAVRNFGKCFLLPFDLLIGFRLKDKRFIKYFDKFSGTTVIFLHYSQAQL